MGESGTAQWRVVIIDDELVDRKDFRRAASKTALVTCLGEAETIAEARTLLAQHTPDCVIVDMRLPDGEGLELVPEYPQLPFIVLTVHDDRETARRSLQSGAQDYLVKGQLSPEGIERSIRYAVERKAHHLMREKLAHQDRLASLGSLATSVAHEINNPIAFISANLTVLREQSSAYRAILEELESLASTVPELRDLLDRLTVPVAHDQLDRILRDCAMGTERIVSIVRQLGSYARGPEAAENPQEVSLTEVATWAMTLTRRTIEARARLNTELDPNLPPFVGRAGRLAQVVTNLLMNASQALETGDPNTQEVYLRTWRDGEQLCLSVEDSGSGFTSASLERAFEPFYTTKARGEGTGLGLAVARDIVRAHQGALELANRAEGGARVTLRIPQDTGLRLTRRPPSRASTPSPGLYRILLIDDEESICRAYQRMLRPHQVVWVGPEGALSTLADPEVDFDLILCDLMMPGMNGVEVYERVRILRPGLLSRIVFLTGGVFTEPVRAFLDTVPNRVLSKPATKDDILEAVALNLQQRVSIQN
ncbi:MAG: response regulator [Deltaproteobacteria bacterium]|nr:response regulator [Deltaproteobacteria bacterium]